MDAFKIGLISICETDIKFNDDLTLAAFPHGVHEFAGGIETSVSFHSDRSIRQEFFRMAILDILEFPDPRLRTRAQPVDEVDDAIKRLIVDMFETMYAAPGIGLAASQVNVHKRVLVIDISEERDRPMAFVNPEIIHREGDEETEEGCLSVPGIYEKVRRAKRITVRALDRNGMTFEMQTDGLLAVCIQHEMDHLEGKLFVDYLSELKRTRIRSKLDKERKESKAPARRDGRKVPAI
jgi:peptide deformylase